MLLWRPAAAHWRGAPGGTAGAVLAAGLAALDAPGYRYAIPAPAAVEVEALAVAGTALNEALRVRYMRGERAGAITAASSSVAACAARLGAGQQPGPAVAALCVGSRDRLVYLRLDPRLHAAMSDAAALNGMGLGAWLRDGIAAELGEHSARRAGPQTREARRVARRIAGLLAQAENVATDRAERNAVEAAKAAVEMGRVHMEGWGART